MNRIITIGGSAGALEAVTKIIKKLDSRLSCPVFLVIHTGSPPSRAMKHRLYSAGPLPADFAEDGMKIKPGRVYISPPNRHLLIQGDIMRVNKEARVNRSRPAIDLLFRSAAVAYNTRTVSVLLSGMLYDGVSGFQDVQKCDGITIVQDPSDAVYPDLPENALSRMEGDYMEPASSIGPLLNRLGSSPPSSSKKVPFEVRMENSIDLSHEDSISHLDQLGERIPITCPDCGGQLWEIDRQGEELSHFRCHTGHTMDVKSLLLGQDEEIEKVLWVALRTLEEKVLIQEKLVKSGGKTCTYNLTESFAERAAETKKHANRLRKLLLEINETQGNLK